MTELEGGTTPNREGIEVANAGEFAAMWNARTPEERELLLVNIKSAANDGYRCFIEDHAGRIQALTPPEPVTALDHFQVKVLADLEKATEDYVNGMCQVLDLSVEELATRYALEYEPIQLEHTNYDTIRDDVRLRVTQRVRLVRREDKQ